MSCRSRQQHWDRRLAFNICREFRFWAPPSTNLTPPAHCLSSLSSRLADVIQASILGTSLCRLPTFYRSVHWGWSLILPYCCAQAPVLSCRMQSVDLAGRIVLMMSPEINTLILPQVSKSTITTETPHIHKQAYSLAKNGHIRIFNNFISTVSSVTILPHTRWRIPLKRSQYWFTSLLKHRQRSRKRRLSDISPQMQHSHIHSVPRNLGHLIFLSSENFHRDWQSFRSINGTKLCPRPFRSKSNESRSTRNIWSYMSTSISISSSGLSLCTMQTFVSQLSWIW